MAPIALLIAVVGLGVAGRSGSSTDRPGSTILGPAVRPTVMPSFPLMPIVADRREHGTDGLMGRLPFDLPPDPVAPRVNRFTIDDVAAVRAARDTTPPWVRRFGFLSAYRADPNWR